MRGALGNNETVSESELWDLTDAQGNRSGLTHRRGALDWPAGYFHIVAATCVVRADNLVLLTKRAATKDYPLTWEFPAGSALAGETSVEAAIRELREETGLSVSPREMNLVGRFTEPRALVDLFVARIVDASALSLDPEEVTDAEWVTLDEVARRRKAGIMAAPWDPRLAAMWSQLVDLVDRRAV